MKFAFAILILFEVLSCTPKLLFPLEGGIEYTPPDGHKFMGDEMYLVPKKSKSVRVVENCKIAQVVRGDDSAFFILADGKLSVAYGNIEICYVAKGQNLKGGEIIGELFDSADAHKNILEFSARENGVYIRPKW